MRSKAPLALMEQAIMVLVFALAAALCLQAFVWSDRTSRQNQDRDQAMLLAQSAAEALKQAGGDMAHAQAQTAERLEGQVSQGMLYAFFDGEGRPASQEAAVYRLNAQGEPTQIPGLWQAQVWVTREVDGMMLAQLPVAWQGEVAYGG